MRFPINDKRTYAFVSDKWAINNKVTLNLGVRHDYSEMTPQKDAFQPRLGVVYAPEREDRDPRGLRQVLRIRLDGRPAEPRWPAG